MPTISRTRTALALMLCAIAGTAHAQAQGIDLMRATCADYVGMGSNDQSQLALWLAGYYAGLAQRPTLDLDRITAAPGELAALCAKSPQQALIGAETRAIFLPAP